MRRFLGLLVLLLFAIPASVSVVGCKHALAPTFCPGFADSGPVAGQITKITFGGSLTTVGESLNYGQIGSSLSATATDCFGSSVSTPALTYGTSNMQIADINPSTGQVCAGTWNRNTGGGVADYSVCAPPSVTPSSYIAYVTASASGATSNPIPIYVHPVVTSVSIGSATPTASCNATSTLTGNTTAGSNVVTAVSSTAGLTVNQGIAGNGIPVGSVISSIGTNTLTISNSATATATTDALTISVVDPSSNCCPANSSLITTTAKSPYDQASCISQNLTTQLVARVYTGGLTDPAHNITCQAGHITFTPQSSSNVVSIDANGIATAAQPGSTTVLASVSNSGSASTAGFFSTCPPTSITLTSNGSKNISLALNNAQPLTTVVTDQYGATISGLTLEFLSTSPQTLSAGGGTVTPSFPGVATITAVCQPGTCNPSPYSQIGYLSNGKPITSNGVTVTTTGTSSNQVIVASTDSLFFYSVDFTVGTTGSVFKLPYQPNSMVITQDGSTAYLGSTNVLMSISTANGSVSSIGAIPGTVLAVSPDGSTLVIADATRNVTSLYTSSGGLQSTTNGVGVRAQWTPDSTTVYIAAGNQMLVHSSFTGWTSTPVAVNYQDVAVTVPAYGAYFAAGTETDGRTYCATSVGTTPSNPPPAVSNTFFPLADTQTSALATRVASTTDGAHVLGGGINAGTGAASLYDVALPAATTTSSADPRLACTISMAPVTFTSSTSVKTLPMTATAITGIVPASTSNLAFVTYTAASKAAGGVLPFYLPPTGTVGSLALSGSATAPVAGAFSSDNKTFYTSTSGDNALHIITVNGTTSTDSSTLPLNLPSISTTGATAVPNLIVQRVKKATS